jgi:hypothetical protein
VKALAALTTALLMAGGGALLWGNPAVAQDSSSSDASTGAATTSLGGYTLGGTGAGLSIYYEQPNLPVPATPTLEGDAGYSDATFDAGPIGTANASTFWPGSVVAGSGSELNLLVGPYLQQYCGASCNSVTLPDLGNWPIDASTNYPQGPDTDTDDNGPSTMEADSNATASTASASLSTIGGAGTSALSSGLVSAQGVASSAEGTIGDTGDAVAEATSDVQGVSIAGGLIDVGQVTSTATASSDGNQATVDGSSAASGVTVAGQSVTVDSSGVQSTGAGNENLLGSLLPSVNQVLSTAGITMTLTSPTDTVNGPSGQRQLDGLEVTINLTTYDKDFTSLVAMLPSQLKSEIYQLPAPLPDEQIATIDFGWVNVSAAASPAFDFSSPSSIGGTTGGPSTPLGGLPTSSGSPSTFGGVPSAGSGSSSAPGTGGTGPGAGTGTGGSGGTTALATAPAALFKGIGTGLIALGLLLGAILAFFLIRVDGAVGALGAGQGCIDPPGGR